MTGLAWNKEKWPSSGLGPDRAQPAFDFEFGGQRLPNTRTHTHLHTEDGYVCFQSQTRRRLTWMVAVSRVHSAYIPVLLRWPGSGPMAEQSRSVLGLNLGATTFCPGALDKRALPSAAQRPFSQSRRPCSGEDSGIWHRRSHQHCPTAVERETVAAPPGCRASMAAGSVHAAWLRAGRSGRRDARTQRGYARSLQGPAGGRVCASELPRMRQAWSMRSKSVSCRRQG